VASLQVRTFPGALHTLLASPSSDVARELAKFGAKVESQAKMNASGRPGPNVVTGRLRASIGWRLEFHDEVELYVGFGAYYGIYLEQGNYPFLGPAIRQSGGAIGTFG
jgi:hypothetical protein